MKKVFDHLILLFGVFLMIGPIVVAFITSTHEPTEIYSKGLMITWGDHFYDTYHKVSGKRRLHGQGHRPFRIEEFLHSRHRLCGGQNRAVDAGGLCHRLFPLPYGRDLLLDDLHHAAFAAGSAHSAVLCGDDEAGVVDTYTGLIVPLLASATGTFYFRQFFRSVPEELLEAARIDGAGRSSSSSTSWSRCRAT